MLAAGVQILRSSGVQILGNLRGGARESESESEEERKEAADMPASRAGMDEASTAQIPATAMEEDEDEDEDGQEEEEDEQQAEPDAAMDEDEADQREDDDEPAEQTKLPDQSGQELPDQSGQENEEEESQQEDEDQQEEEGEEPDPAAQSMEAEREDEVEHQIVPAEPEPLADSQGSQIVAFDAGGAGDAWENTLPPEASGAWTVAGDVCSLKIAGAELRLPRSVHDRLYGYQREGVVWMWNLFHKTFGGILADEMGLGKTVQTAAFLASLKYTEQASRFLVVVPVTLLDQWRRELNTWAQNTGLAVHVMHGSAHERKTALRGLANRGGVLLISHDLIRTCIHQTRTAGLATSAGLQSKKRKRQAKRGVKDDDSPSEAEEEAPVAPRAGDTDETPWDVVIVDEGHQIKNPSCQTGRALRRIDAVSRFLLTGTPLQNKLSDLWALMDFAQPALLGNHATFERNFSEQIAKGSKRNASRFAVELKDHLAKELKRITAPHFLRRLKGEVMGSTSAATAAAKGGEVPEELPQKMDVVLWLSLTQAQTELYDLSLKSDLVRSASGSTKCGMEALRAIALLKKLCGHPLLCLPQEEYNQWRMKTLAGGTPGASAASAPSALPVPETQPDDQEDMSTQPAPECQELIPRLRALLPNSAQGAALLSCKLRILSVLLPQLQKRGHRCLIFSQSVRMLDLIQACVLRVLGLKFLRIDGSIDPKDRDIKLNKFQQADSKYFALCMSVQVGGTGLTVTGADRVILVDPAWNPSADAQAIDRVHRIGQTRNVVVYRLIASGAIEDKMFRLQIFKRGLSKTFMEHEQQVRFFTHKQLKQLFEAPNQSTSTQSLMAEQIGTEALEHEDLLNVVAGDVGSTDDPEAAPFWQSQDVLGFSDYQRLFMFLEHADKEDEQQAVEQAKELTAKLRSEEYVQNQVVDGKWRRVGEWSKENVSPQEAAAADMMPLEDA
eukprot:TRINITY_DN10596_c0_g1_i1.p1 TRINITY_DN10596_c0_g1~~TRINITY_DN10596_c0_g1_i1.p1  ORF type:complete len:983 (-),score=258.61 TRINITY_DN10596_c0_g1_i1:183-3050(-)